jgi:anti-sigma factor RsiW
MDVHRDFGDHVDDKISDLIEGALDSVTRHRVHRHLVGCRRCRELLYRTYEMLALLAALAPKTIG